MELEIEDVVVSSLVREKALSSAANASVGLEPIADFPKSTKGVAGGGRSLVSNARAPKNQTIMRAGRNPRNKDQK